MKICFITNNIFTLGGVQRVVSVLANELSSIYDVTILCTDSSHKENREVYNLKTKVKVKYIDLFSRSRIKKYLYKPIKVLNKKGMFNFNSELLFNAYYRINEKQLIYILNNEKYDVVIGVEGEYSVILGKISDKISAKSIGWQHNSYDAYFRTYDKYYWDQNKIFNKYLKKLDYCITLTKDDKEKFIKNFNCKCETIYNPLSFRSEVKSDCKKNNILFVGRLVKQQKGLDLLIDAFKIIHNKQKDWNLNIVGDGPDKQWLIDKIHKENLINNTKIINVTNNMKKYYLDSSILVSTSRWEGFGLVITEAMECGVPVVSFRNSGPSEIINKNEYNGILINNYDCNELAKKVIELIYNDKKRLYISDNAIKRAEDFNVTKIVEKWRTLIESIT